MDFLTALRIFVKSLSGMIRVKDCFACDEYLKLFM